MHVLVPFAFGVIAFAMIAASGSIGGALIFGPVIGAMVWGSFFWRPGNVKPVMDSEAIKTSNESFTPTQVAEKLSKLSPLEVGQLLAHSLSESCGHDSISPKTKEVLATTGISLEKYLHESLLLAAFAQDSTVAVSLSRNPAVRNAVHQGYRGVWLAISNKNEEGALLYKDFLSRCQVYARAIARSDPGAISAVAMEFGEFLTPGEASGQMVGLVLADGLYHVHFESTLNILQQSGCVVVGNIDA